MSHKQDDPIALLSFKAVGVCTQIVSHGGDVMRFAGDSMICAFLPTPEEEEAQDNGLAAATLRSVQCASKLAHDLGNYNGSQ